MKQALLLIWDFRFMIISIIAGILYLLKDWHKAKGDIYNLMLQAKRMAKDGILKSGEAQEEWVINMALNKLPTNWVESLGRKNTQKLVRWLYKKGMDVLDDGMFNDSWP